MENVRRKVGAITIGQSPRVDMTPEILDILGPGVELIEGGALDGLNHEEVARMTPKEGEIVLVTRMRDGTSVKIAEHHILPRMQNQIDRVIAEGAQVVALVCTGEFPQFKAMRLVVEAQRVLNHSVAAVARGRRVGVLVPAAEQVAQCAQRWEIAQAAELRILSASPYEDMIHTATAAEDLKRWGAELTVLDCMGFTKAHKERVATITDAPVVLPRTVLARMLVELM